MNKITVITGGCRSGKSSLAVKKAKKISENVCFIATCVPQDEQMKTRVAKHKTQRPQSWHVIEEPIHIAEAIAKVDSDKYPVVLMDCLTLWVCNLMCREENAINSEEEMTSHAEKLAKAVQQFNGDVIIVTNEVGMGIMPANEMARSYTDLVGRCNQIIATNADEVVFVASGIPLTLKAGV